MNNTVVNEENPPTPQERAEVATEQEQVRQMIENTIGELNTYFAHATKLGMLIHMREDSVEVTGMEVPRQVLSVVRIMAVVGYRRPKNDT